MMSEHPTNSYPLMELNNPEPRPHSDTVGIMGLKSERKAFPLKHCDYEMAFQRSMKNDVSRRAERTLIFVSLLTLLFIIAELIGGYLAHSLAIVSDAFHMISDLGSFLISITAIHLARKKPTARYSYGFQRTEVLGALTSILIIWILTGVLIYMAIERILTNDLEVEADTMMITAGIGVVFNMVMGVCLYFGKTGHSHFGMSHSHHHHGHSHGHGQKVSNVENLSEKTIKSLDEEAHQHHHSHHHHHQENINLRAAFVHVLGDLVQSMGVLLAAVIIKFTGFTLADPICTFLFGVLVLLTTHGIFKDTILVLMEATPHHVSMNKVHEDLTSIDGVSSIHSLRIWSLKLDSTAISVHLDIQPGADVSAVVRQAQHKLQHEHGIDYITVQAQCSLSNASSEVQLLGV